MLEEERVRSGSLKGKTLNSWLWSCNDKYVDNFDDDDDDPIAEYGDEDGDDYNDDDYGDDDDDSCDGEDDKTDETAAIGRASARYWFVWPYCKFTPWNLFQWVYDHVGEYDDDEIIMMNMMMMHMMMMMLMMMVMVT